MSRRIFEHGEVVAGCDVCGGDRARVLDAAAHVVECERCGHRFVSPRPAQAEIADAYSDPHFYDHWLAAEPGRRRMWAKRLARLQRFSPGRRLLDVGAGIGSFLALARDGGAQVTGTEVSASAIQLARERHGIALLQGQLEELDLPPESFDVVTLWHVLEHLPSPSRALQACRRVLVPGGLLLVAVPNDSDLAFQARRVKHRAVRLLRRSDSLPPRYEPLTPGAEVHLSHFTTRTLKNLLERNGFEVVAMRVDDQYPEPSWKTAALVAGTRVALRLTRINFASAMLAAARKAQTSGEP